MHFVAQTDQAGDSVCCAGEGRKTYRQNSRSYSPRAAKFFPISSATRDGIKIDLNARANRKPHHTHAQRA